MQLLYFSLYILYLVGLLRENLKSEATADTCITGIPYNK